MPDGASVNDYIQTLRTQAAVLEELRDAGLILHHRGENAFWFVTDDPALAAKYDGREGRFDEGASLTNWLEDVERAG